MGNKPVTKWFTNAVSPMQKAATAIFQSNRCMDCNNI